MNHKRKRDNYETHNKYSNKYNYEKKSSEDSHTKESKDKSEYDTFNRYRQELNKLLTYKEPFVNSLDDLWIFISKFEIAENRLVMSMGTKNSRQTDLVNFRLKEKLEKLYDKLPIYDRNGDKIKIEYAVFKKFIDIVLLYLDFKQKEKFAKLKKLRKTQSQLPIAEFKQEIIESVKNNRVVLIAGDTGCGKSTQVPQYIHSAGFNKIACTQPRRIACISLAKRVSYETLTECKSLVGYQIRFEKTKRKDTQLIFITEGLLLRQASDEDTLLSYDVVILDEVHERHLYGDFLIGIMKCLLYKRDDFKLILMSATINIKLFCDYFANENVKLIQVPGRLYPIEIIYKPIIQDRFDKKTAKFDSTPYLQVLQIIDQKYSTFERGDLLIFLSGMADITKLSEDIMEYSKEKQNWIILQLHSSLSLAEQDKVFDYAPEGVRKCIISTNIAETSVTIDGVRFVIDSGKVNKMSYTTIGGINKLTEQSISQDSAKQRSGRAGRTGPGVCYRLYAEEEFTKFDPFTIAEIHLVPLEALVLHMVSLGLRDICNFPFLEKPNLNAITEAINRLHFYGAIVSPEDIVLTSLGEALSKLPVDLTIGKMLISSTVFRNVTGILCLAAVISVQTPFTNRAYRDLECQSARRLLESNHGDPITLLNLFKEWLSIKQNSQPIQSRKSEQVENTRHWSKKRGLEEQRFYEVMKLMTQFKDILQDSNLLNKIESKEHTSAERSMRYGELKKLKSMRYELKNSMRSSNRKRLKYKYGVNGEDDDDEHNSKSDIRDVEFRINNDNETLEKLLNETSIESFRDLTLLKLTLCSGLYPQVAVADEYNYCKSHQEQLFHTKHKCFVSLHPMSYFGNNTDDLKLCEDDIEVPPEGFFSKSPLSSRHQLLIYQSLLETTKVYLMNTMRMPVIQTLLLFSKNIQTNETITRIACDEFLIMDLPHFGQGKSLLLKAIYLRNEWTKLLNNKLEDKVQSDIFDNISEELIHEIMNFMSMRASYTVKRLLKADLKKLYTLQTIEDLLKIDKNPFDMEFTIKPDETCGGIKVSDNVTYSCIVEEEWSYNLAQQISETPLNCPVCDLMVYGSFLVQLQHESSCKMNTKAKAEEKMSVKSSVHSANAKKYDCEICKKTLYLTVTDILKHKKTCK